MRTISIIGPGRAGGALAIALAAKGYKIENLFARDPEKAGIIAAQIEPAPEIYTENSYGNISSEIILITTQDTEIVNVVGQLSGLLQRSHVVFHTSGSLSSEILNDLKAKGCRVGSLHPLASISGPEDAARKFEGVYFCVEGDEKAVEVGEKIVADLGGNAFTIETRFKSLYHAAAVMSAGHLTGLADAAFEMMAGAGMDRGQARNVLLPLIKSTVANLEVQAPAEALTGTFARADEETFGRHIASMKDTVSPEIVEIYLLLAARSLELARQNGVSPERVDALLKKVLIAKNELR